MVKEEDEFVERTHNKYTQIVTILLLCVQNVSGLRLLYGKERHQNTDVKNVAADLMILKPCLLIKRANKNTTIDSNVRCQ